MISSTVHVHTTFCDGNNSMADMAEAALEKGIQCIGFSGHSFTEHDGFGIKPEMMHDYVSEAKRLKKLYNGKMQVLCGLELDAITNHVPLEKQLDYIIGSAHSVRGDDGVDYVIDGSVKRFEQNVRIAFDGSYEKMYKAYYKQFADFLTAKKPDIAGHFDLVTKYNEKYGYFDSNCATYKNAALEALDAALEASIVVEVNTGAMTRGYRSSPYPADFLLKHILQKKGRVIITTDAHAVSALTGYVNETEEILKGLGFLEVCELSDNGFYSRPL